MKLFQNINVSKNKHVIWLNEWVIMKNDYCIMQIVFLDSRIRIGTKAVLRIQQYIFNLHLLQLWNTLLEHWTTFHFMMKLKLKNRREMTYPNSKHSLKTDGIHSMTPCSKSASLHDAAIVPILLLKDYIHQKSKKNWFLIWVLWFGVTILWTFWFRHRALKIRKSNAQFSKSDIEIKKFIKFRPETLKIKSKIIKFCNILMGFRLVQS